jgi:RNA polymerase sigma-70 factor (ECF subfamily)
VHGEDEWLRIYHETLDPLYGYVSRRTGGDRQLTEDTIQEAWLRALGDWPRQGLPRQPLAWLRTVCRNLLCNHYRRRSPVSLEQAGIDPGQPAPPETPEAAALLGWGLARLGERRARLLEAFHLEGRPVAELARELRLSPRAVEGRLRRARQQLARILRRHVTGAEQ